MIVYVYNEIYLIIKKNVVYIGMSFIVYILLIYKNILMDNMLV